MKRLELVTRVTGGQLGRRFKRAPLVWVGVFGVLLYAHGVQAASVYNFVQRDTEDVLATLVLDGEAPWGHEDVLSLSFTEAGDAIFGFGTGLYSGDFDSTIAQFEPDSGMDLEAGLQADIPTFNAQIIDNNPPSAEDYLILEAGVPGTADLIVLGTSAIAVGDFLVPEPGSMGLAFLASVGMVACRRRRLV